MRIKFARSMAIAALAVLGLAAIPAHADNVTWTDWSQAGVITSSTSGGSVSGSIATSPTPVTVNYSGEVESLQLDYPSWQPSSSYVGGTVENAPPQDGNIIQLFGGQSQPPTDTITFSVPVTDPVMAIWSLGNGNQAAEFDFTADEPFTLEAGGPSNEYGGSSIYTNSASPNNVYGAEGNGTIQFNGTFSTISWTNPVFENWYGFTVGIEGVAPTGVPLPASVSMFAVCMAGLLGWRAVRSLNRQAATSQA